MCCIIGCDHSLDGNDIFKFIFYFIILFLIYLRDVAIVWLTKLFNFIFRSNKMPDE
jgi:hypothetical protein